MKNPHELIFTHPCSRTHSDDYIIKKSVAKQYGQDLYHNFRFWKQVGVQRAGWFQK